MAAVSATIDIDARPSRILAVLADLEQYPRWSSVHKRAEVVQRFPDGHPKRATMTVVAVGLADEQTLDYEWSDQGVSWSLVSSSQQKNQHGSYQIDGGSNGVSHVRYELSIDPLLPMPGLLVRQVMKKALTAATDGLKHYLESSP